MIRPFKADLHVHSVLSPCAAVEMTPRNIVWHAAANGIDILAITDHNAADNVIAAFQAAKDAGITIIPGMEVETREEAHLIVLFEKMRQLKEWQQYVDVHRGPSLNDEQKFGAQFIVDAEDNLLSVKPEMLLAPLSAGLDEITRQVTALGGICIASHIDRPSYSILSQLGFIPDGLDLTAVEISRRLKPQDAAQKFPSLKALPIVMNSDAHTIDDLIDGPKTVFHIEEPTLAEIIMALKGLNGRKAVV